MVFKISLPLIENSFILSGPPDSPVINWLIATFICLLNVTGILFSLIGLRPDFTSKLVHVLVFGTPKFYIAPYDKIKHKLVNLSSNCDVKSGLSHKKNQAVSKPDLPNEDLCEDETTLYAILTY